MTVFFYVGGKLVVPWFDIQAVPQVDHTVWLWSREERREVPHQVKYVEWLGPGVAHVRCANLELITERKYEKPIAGSTDTEGGAVPVV